MQRQAALHLLGLQETVRVHGSVLLCDVLGGFAKQNICRHSGVLSVKPGLAGCYHQDHWPWNVGGFLL